MLNPTKSEIGLISKQIIERINSSIRKLKLYTQWTNTDQVLEWFKALPNRRYQFLKFDIVEFYPSISVSLLSKALNFATKFVTITEQERKIIFHATKSVLIHKGATWTKRGTNSQDELFDVTMGGYHGAEICELVGLFMLDGLVKIIPGGKVGLYRDDGMAIIPKQLGRTSEQLIQSIHTFTNSIGLRVELEPPSTRTEFLDVVMDLENRTFSPYRKPNSEIKYINSKSNHPYNITGQMKNMIQDLISRRSSNKAEFDKAAPTYRKALTSNGYDGDIAYQGESKDKKRRRTRSRIWFNPPFCKSVKTNLGKIFIALVKKHFNKNNPLSKIINNHKVGFSYSCMPNMQAIITAHNKKVMATNQQAEVLPCNCQKKDECPIKDGTCRTENVVYKATVVSATDKKTYIGLASTEFKQRWRLHKSSFKNKNKSKSTALAGHIHKLADNNTKYDLSWKIIKKTSRPRPGKGNTCRLCLKEAREILKEDPCSLNKRSEVTGSCIHLKKFYLDRWEWQKELPKDDGID